MRVPLSGASTEKDASDEHFMEQLNELSPHEQVVGQVLERLQAATERNGGQTRIIGDVPDRFEMSGHRSDEGDRLAIEAALASIGRGETRTRSRLTS